MILASRTVAIYASSPTPTLPPIVVGPSTLITPVTVTSSSKIAESKLAFPFTVMSPLTSKSWVFVFPRLALHLTLILPYVYNVFNDDMVGFTISLPPTERVP